MKANRGRLLELILLVAILGAAACLRFPGLRSNPGWYTDEGAFLNVGRNLAEGRWQYFAIQESPLLVGRPPLFFYLLALSMRLFGPDILALRLLAAGASLLSVAGLYWFGRDQFSPRVGLAAAAVLAVLTGAVAYNRIGFTYNLLAPIILWGAFALGRWLASGRRRWGLLAGLAAGLAVSCDYLGIALALVVCLAVYFRRPAFLPEALLAMGAVFALVLAPLLWSAPQAAIADLAYTFLRAGGGAGTAGLGPVSRYAGLFTKDTWVTLGLLGLLFLPRGRGRTVAWAIAGMALFLVLRVYAPYGQGYFYLIPLFPWVALGIAALIRHAAGWLWTSLENPPAAWERMVLRRLSILRLKNGLSLVAVILIFGIPLAWMGLVDLAGVRSSLPTQFERGLSSAGEIAQISGFLNARLEASDLVLASPQVAWQVRGRAADFQQAAACQGAQSFALPDLPPERMAFNCAFERARFVVLDPLWLGWGAGQIPALHETIAEVQAWPLVFQAGEFQVYENPGASQARVSAGGGR